MVIVNSFTVEESLGRFDDKYVVRELLTMFVPGKQLINKFIDYLRFR